MPLICCFAHSIREPLSAVPTFAVISRIMRRNVAGSMRSSLQTCRSVLRAARARSTIDSSLVNVGSNWKAEVRLILINLGSCVIGSPIRLATGPPFCDGAPRSPRVCSRPGSVF
jgi:hypothetical protein